MQASAQTSSAPAVDHHAHPSHCAQAWLEMTLNCYYSFGPKGPRVQPPPLTTPPHFRFRLRLRVRFDFGVRLSILESRFLIFERRLSTCGFRFPIVDFVSPELPHLTLYGSMHACMGGCTHAWMHACMKACISSMISHHQSSSSSYPTPPTGTVMYKSF